MKLDATIKEQLIANGMNAEAIEKWDPKMQSDADMASDKNTLRIAKVIGSTDMESYEDAVSYFFMPIQMKEFLEQADGEDVTLEINSPGGSVFSSSEIASMINDYEGKVTAIVTGQASSGASVIAAAADEVVMAPSGLVMIHSASTVVWGNAKSMRETADLLDKMSASLAVYYEKRMDKEVVAEMLADGDNWLNAEEALEIGFADSIQEVKSAEEDDSKEGDDAEQESEMKNEAEVRSRVASMEVRRMKLLGLR